MRREPSPPRHNWQARAESRGFGFHTLAGKPYWDESACYVFSRAEIDALEKATDALHAMCLTLVQRVIDEKLYGLFLIPPAFEAFVEASWNADERSLYGRFDFAYDGHGPPKLLEYNADTPTGLLEASVIQWDWLQDTDPAGDQFNSIDERLVETAWPALLDTQEGPITFTGLTEHLEDLTTLEYLRDTAIRAGATTALLDLAAIGWDARRNTFTDANRRPLERVFKLYPWEWLVKDAFGKHLLTATTRWIEPPWKMVLSAKAILPLLWEMFPESPYLLPASFEPLPGDHVRKPVHAREGANIRAVRGGQVVAETSGPYDERAAVYQQLAPLRAFEGKYPVLGSWVIHGWASGLGVREDDTLITQNSSRFVPHKMG